MRHIPVLAASLTVLMSGVALAQSSSSAPPPPPPQSSAQNARTDMGCRRQAASQSGYSSANSSDSDAQHRYADAYYACMDDAYGPPAPAPGYAYGSPPPPPYYYGGYPYPYYYPPYYYGPGVSFGFRFGGGGFRGRWR